MDFEKERTYLLSGPYTRGFDKEEADEYVRSADPEFFTSWHFEKKKGKPLIQPRGGMATFQDTYQLYKSLTEAGTDILPLTIDSHTRQNDYDKASELLRLSEENNTNLLNGYPLVNHGYKITRKLIQPFLKPVSLRHGTPDARLLVEIAIASGIFEIEGGPITYVLPYSKNFPLDQAFLYWNYIEKLCARYSTINQPIIRESFGPLTATMVPPCITIAVELIEMLLSALEGNKFISLAFSQTGSFEQDLAIAHTLRLLVKKYLVDFNLEDVITYLVYHHWMGAFPKDKSLSDSLINLGNVISILINADKVIIKTRDEAYGLPEIASNVTSVKQARYLQTVLTSYSIFNEIIEEESLMIREEVTSIMDNILNFTGDTLWRKAFNAIKNGLIDIPFSPHSLNMGALVTTRDKQGMIRIYNPGKVPLPEKSIIKEHEKSENALKGNKLVTNIINGINFMS
jgi:methylaspartate mutase epsilon subunit